MLIWLTYRYYFRVVVVNSKLKVKIFMIFLTFFYCILKNGCNFASVFMVLVFKVSSHGNASRDASMYLKDCFKVYV